MLCFICTHFARRRLSVLSLSGCSAKNVVWRAYWNRMSNIRDSSSSSSERSVSSLISSAPIWTLTGVFGRESLSLYKTAYENSSIFGKINSAKYFAHDLSRNFFSPSVIVFNGANRDSCCTSNRFGTNDIKRPPIIPVVSIIPEMNGKCSILQQYIPFSQNSYRS